MEGIKIPKVNFQINNMQGCQVHFDTTLESGQKVQGFGTVMEDMNDRVVIALENPIGEFDTLILAKSKLMAN